MLQEARHRRDAQIAAALVRKEERARRKKTPAAEGTEPKPAADEGKKPRKLQPTDDQPQPDALTPAAARIPETPPETITEEEWQAQVQRYEERVPPTLEEAGTLTEIRAARKQARKEAKQYRAARRVRRLQQRRELTARLKAANMAGQAARLAVKQRKVRKSYEYAQQGNYGDVELRAADDGKTQRVGHLRATSSSSPSCLPTALIALTKTHTHEVRLDTCAQFSVAGEELRRYGRCVSREAPVDVVEGFGGGISRVLGVWRFIGTTQYQQRIEVDALLVEGQGDEFLIGEDWMVAKQVKLDFGGRELKYRDEQGQKVILPFTCYGLNSLPTSAGERRAVVRLAKTVKLATNTRSIVRVAVDAADGTTGVFLPKPSNKRHLMLAPTVDTVRGGKVRIAVLNVEGRREKLPAREALGTWIPADADMQILEVNGEFERTRVAEWVSKLREKGAAPLKDEDKLNIGEMEAEDRELVLALLRQYADVVERKEGCPPLSKTGVVHHINTGDADHAAPTQTCRSRECHHR